jgi:formylglycine-generating enzyme required for sulfatase activity
VDYIYNIGKHEISRDMVTKANAAGNLGVTLDSLEFVTDSPRPEMPATGISWFEAAKFVNWLNTSSGFPAAYKFNKSGEFQLWQAEDRGFDASNRFRNRLARYFLPSVHEWYKAAYYEPTSGQYFDYPTGSDTVPTPVAGGVAEGTAVYGSEGLADVRQAGGRSPYGTVAQGGNAAEWEETEYDLLNDRPLSIRGVRGGGLFFISDHLSASLRNGVGHDAVPALEDGRFGFRVASIPEPNSLRLISLATLGLLQRRRSLPGRS